MRVRQADPACRRCCILKGARLGKVCALVTDGRFSGGSSGVAVGHISPEAAAGGVIGLVEDGDRIVIDVEDGRVRAPLAAGGPAAPGGEVASRVRPDGHLCRHRRSPRSAPLTC